MRIAAAALGRQGGLFVRDVAQAGDRIEWRIGTATVGSGWTVRIDDATGAVLATERWGVR